LHIITFHDQLIYNPFLPNSKIFKYNKDEEGNDVLDITEMHKEWNKEDDTIKKVLINKRK
jgi:hypothetical protein